MAKRSAALAGPCSCRPQSFDGFWNPVLGCPHQRLGVDLVPSVQLVSSRDFWVRQCQNKSNACEVRLCTVLLLTMMRYDGPWMLSSQDGLDHGCHHAWANGCSSLRKGTVDVIMLGTWVLSSQNGLRNPIQHKMDRKTPKTRVLDAKQGKTNHANCES